MNATSSQIKVAVATKNGAVIDEHFGHAKFFDIYQLAGKQPTFLERRQVDHYCHGGSGDKTAMMRILDSINDCQAVLVARIGDGPSEKLARQGVSAICDYPWEEVHAALLQYQRTLDA